MSNNTNSLGPAPYAAAPADESFVVCLATVYEHLVKLNTPNHDQITRFHAIKPPDIPIKAYLERIRQYFDCSNECFVLSLIYIDRIVKLHSNISVSILNVHRLLATSIMLAAKFFDDVYYSNAFYARVGGVRTREINILEAHFLSLLDFHLYVSPQEYEQYRQNVLAAVNFQHWKKCAGEAPGTDMFLAPMANQYGCDKNNGAHSNMAPIAPMWTADPRIAYNAPSSLHCGEKSRLTIQPYIQPTRHVGLNSDVNFHHHQQHLPNDQLYRTTTVVAEGCCPRNTNAIGTEVIDRPIRYPVNECAKQPIQGPYPHHVWHLNRYEPGDGHMRQQSVVSRPAQQAVKGPHIQAEPLIAVGW